MLDTVRAYGAEWLEATGDAGRLRRRHRDWYLGLATWCELEWFSPRQREVAVRVEAELPNLRTALECCLTEPEEAHLGSIWRVRCGSAGWAAAGSRRGGAGWSAVWSWTRARAVPAEGAVGARLRGDPAGDTVPALQALQVCREQAERSADAHGGGAYAEHRTGCLALVLG